MQQLLRRITFGWEFFFVILLIINHGTQQILIKETVVVYSVPRFELFFGVIQILRKIRIVHEAFVLSTLLKASDLIVLNISMLFGSSKDKEYQDYYLVD